MRSTSGMTCCHFFCSAVFSMPVCRKPMVVSALTMVSPESCTMMFNTPCVLGCCGPMLTVMVSVRSSGEDKGSAVILYPRGFAPRTPLHARSRAASPARSARVAHSLRSFASWFDHSRLEAVLDDFADHVHQRPMNLLHARGVLVRHVDVDVGG